MEFATPYGVFSRSAHHEYSKNKPPQQKQKQKPRKISILRGFFVDANAKALSA
ncbi:hypothetical protein OKW49_002427 [Paraburkholderia youngii]